MEEQNYKIGELAKLTGLTTRTLRYYEELELIRSARTQGGQRVFDSRCPTRLNIIESLKLAGFSLLEIRHILRGWKESAAGAEAAEKLLSILQTKHEEVTKTVTALNDLKKQIESSITMLGNCACCSEKPASTLCDECEASLQTNGERSLIDEIIKE